MKNRMLIALLSSLVALPVLAQQSNANAGAASGTTSGREPLQPPAHTDFWDGDEPGLGALILHPMASKKYVQRHVQPIKDRLSELDELTSENTKMTRDVDSRAQQGIQLASAKTNLADEHAQDAATKAQMAQQSAAALSTRVSGVETSVGSIDQYKAANQTEIRFRAGQTALSKPAKDALDQIAGQLKGQHGYIIEVQGFSSGKGQAAIANSRKMADSVVRYLVLNHEIPAYRIFVLGLGSAATDSQSSGSRVEISLLRNGLDQTAQK